MEQILLLLSVSAHTSALLQLDGFDTLLLPVLCVDVTSAAPSVTGQVLCRQA